jgi:hypothetical protein
VLTTRCRDQEADWTRDDPLHLAHRTEPRRRHVGAPIDPQERKGLQEGKQVIELLGRSKAMSRRAGVAEEVAKTWS